jgi:hypothetical protein
MLCLVHEPLSSHLACWIVEKPDKRSNPFIGKFVLFFLAFTTLLNPKAAHFIPFNHNIW